MSLLLILKRFLLAIYGKIFTRRNLYFQSYFINYHNKLTFYIIQSIRCNHFVFVNFLNFIFQILFFKLDILSEMTSYNSGASINFQTLNYISSDSETSLQTFPKIGKGAECTTKVNRPMKV